MTDQEPSRNGSTQPAVEQTRLPSEIKPREEFPVSKANMLDDTASKRATASSQTPTTLNGYTNGQEYAQASHQPTSQATPMVPGPLPGRTSTPPIRQPSYMQLPQHPPTHGAASPYSRTASPAGHAHTPYPPVVHTLQSMEQRYTPAEKGKGRAADSPATLNGVGINNGHGHGNGNGSPMTGHQLGQGKREKKVRRLSSTSEMNPNVTGTPDEAKRRKNMNHRSQTPPPTTTPPPPKALSAEEKAYFDRVEINKSKPMLSDMRLPCPVWSNTRKALQSAVEYLRAPSRTGGASVDIGPGGMARGVILEGKAPTDLDMWTLNKYKSLLLPIGRPRARRTAKDPSAAIGTETVEKPAAEPEEKAADPLPVETSTSEHKSPKMTTSVIPPKRELESPEVEALLMTHRARVPIALAVAQDYSGVPFRVPRPFIALGWFWIVDAWVEPVVSVINHTQDSSSARTEIDKDRVVWRFRFEYCTGGQDSPWWEPTFNTHPELSCSYVATNVRSWPLTADDRPPTISLVRNQDLAEHGDDYMAHRHCRSCGYGSTMTFWDTSRQDRPASGMNLCLNESCDAWERTAHFFNKPPSAWAASFTTFPASNIQRITPANLGLSLRPPEPTNVDTWAVSQLEHAGREYWTGWVCHKCGCANERRHWYGWSCEGCKRILVTRHVTYHDSQLRAPLRPISTGPRPDDGLATWPFDATFAWTLFDDDIKVVRHGVHDGFGAGTAIYHSLNHQGPALSERRINATTLFQELQRRADFGGVPRQELPYKRHLVNPHTPIPSERQLSPFYTVLLGPEPVPEIESLPSEKPIPWREAEETFLNLADYINERAGQIFPGEAERFNSLLVAVTPPGIPATQAPRIFVPAHAFMSFSFFGSDGVLKIRRPAGLAEGTRKQGQMTLQHGDVVGVQTGPNGLEVSAHQDGFGFLCIGRQIYSTGNDPIARVDVPGLEVIRVRPRKLPNKPPPRPAKLPHVPLTFWYVGPFPLDPERPLRVDPALRVRNSPREVEGEQGEQGGTTSPTLIPEIETEGELRYNGIQVLLPKEGEEVSEPKRLDPPVRAGEGGGRKRKITGSSEMSGGDKDKEKARAKGKSRASKGGQGEDGGSSKKGDTPKKKARKSGAGVDT